jgi:hypothetical protein
MIKPVLQLYFDSLIHLDKLLLSVNVGGLSITNSSKSSFWPILISFNISILAKIVLPVGIFNGKSSKPGSVFSFLILSYLKLNHSFKMGSISMGTSFYFLLAK